MGSTVQYKVRSSHIISVIFFISYSAGRVCLIPFLTVFFHRLGYSPLEVGIIRGIQTLLTIIAAPLLIRCAKACYRWHCILMMPLAISIIMYMCLILTPSFNGMYDQNVTCSDYEIQLKNSIISERQFNTTSAWTVVENSSVEIAMPMENATDLNDIVNSAQIGYHLSNTLAPPSVSSPSDNGEDQSVYSKITSNPVNSNFTFSAVNEHDKENSVSNLIQYVSDPYSTESNKSQRFQRITSKSSSSDLNMQNTMPNKVVKQSVNKSFSLDSLFTSASDQNADYYSNDGLQGYLLYQDDTDYSSLPFDNNAAESVNELPYSESKQESVQRPLATRSIQQPSHGVEFVKSHKRKRSAVFDSTKSSLLGTVLDFTEKLNSSSVQVEEKSNLSIQLNGSNKINNISPMTFPVTDEESSNDTSLSFYFWIACIIAFIGEAFSASVETSADEAWFRYLDEIDYVEKYRQYYIPSSISSSVASFGVTAIASNTVCSLLRITNRFSIHSYAFGIIMLCVLILAYFFPVPQQKTLISEKWSRTSILKIVFSDIRTVLVTISVIISGACYASLHDYFLWYMDDIGANEDLLGIAISVAAISEIPVHLGYRWLIKKLTLYGCISLSLLCYGVRFMYYSFIRSSWALIPMQLLHSLSTALMWRVLQVYVDQISSPGTDRKVQNMFRVIYLGMGYVMGTVFSGFVYGWSGPQFLFWIMAVISCSFSIIFSIAQRYLPRFQRRTYSKILFEGLRDGEERIYHSIGTDSDVDDEDEDWIEKAVGKTWRKKQYRM